MPETLAATSSTCPLLPAALFWSKGSIGSKGTQMIFTPNFWALSSFEPASAPATT